MTLAEERQKTVDASIATIKNLIQAHGVSRASLETVLDEVKKLAANPALWSEQEFAPPELPERQARYLIRKDPDEAFTLYLNVMRRGKRIPPHNHTTWACIAAVEGVETNYLYERRDDGSKSGYADVVEVGARDIAPGDGIALLPEDIHSVEIKSDDVIRHLDLYGRALESLKERLKFDPETKTSEPMPVGVKTRGN